MGSLVKALEGDNADVMNTAVETITQASHKLAEVLYQTSATQEGTSPTEGAANGSPDGKHTSQEDVMDAEYTEVH